MSGQLRLLFLALGLVSGALSNGTVIEAAPPQASPTPLYHPLVLDLDLGETLAENGAVNPFLDRRVEVEWTHVASGTSATVPAYFAADGVAADTGAQSGATFRAHWTPALPGTWTYLVRARSGSNVALDDAPFAGSTHSIDGTSGSFEVGALDSAAPGHLSKGPLQYRGEHQLVFAGTGERFLKTGADSPENWLGYFEFDQTSDLGGLSSGALVGGLHRFDAHLTDFQAQTPEAQAALWNGKGGRILGALDYLASEGVNSIYFLTYNIDGGDGADTWPWTSPSERFRFDVSKLAQWERVFTYADARGIQLHVVLQETENDTALGNGLSDVRKLYFREMIARFGHHHALQWNLGEENQNTPAARNAFAAYFEATDAYAHPVTFHTCYGHAWTEYDPHYGLVEFDATSIQDDAALYHGQAKTKRAASAQAGRPWAVYGDEQGPPVEPDMSNVEFLRKNALYGNLFGGGAGVEWYFGYQTPTFGDIQSDEFRVAEPLWRAGARARRLFEDYVHVERLEPFEWITPEGDDFVLRESGATYLVYKPEGGGVTLNLEGAVGPFSVEWFDPKVDGGPQSGSVTSVSGPGLVNIGTPPFSGDAIAWVHGGQDRAPVIERASVFPATAAPGDDVTFEVVAFDPDGPRDLASAGILAFGPAGAFLGAFPFDELDARRFVLSLENLSLGSGNYTAFPAALDASGNYAIGPPFSLQMAP